jgi:hypothetical protein
MENTSALNRFLFFPLILAQKRKLIKKNGKEKVTLKVKMNDEISLNRKKKIEGCWLVG